MSRAVRAETAPLRASIGLEFSWPGQNPFQRLPEFIDRTSNRRRSALPSRWSSGPWVNPVPVRQGTAIGRRPGSRVIPACVRRAKRTHEHPQDLPGCQPTCLSSRSSSRVRPHRLDLHIQEHGPEQAWQKIVQALVCTLVSYFPFLLEFALSRKNAFASRNRCSRMLGQPSTSL